MCYSRIQELGSPRQKLDGLRHVRVLVPVAVKEGDDAVLMCFFDLNGDSLYSVKWYKGGREMYRYMPREIPSVKVFPIAGLSDLYIEGIKRLYPHNFDRRRELRKLNHSLLVNFLDLLDLLVRCPESGRRGEKVDDLSLLFIHIHHLLNEFRPHQARETLRVMMDLQKRQRLEISQRFQKHLDKKSKSNGTHLFLKKVTINLSGRYSCEVSADAPSFRTALVSGDMNIVVIPSAFPEIKGMKARYKLGDILEVQCISKDSRPAANLTWSLNGKVLDSEYVKQANIKRDYVKGLETAISTLTLSLHHHHFVGGRIKVKCTASIHNIYWQTTENSAGEEKPKDAEPSTSISKDALQPSNVPKEGQEKDDSTNSRGHCRYCASHIFERLKASNVRVPVTLQLVCLYILRYNIIS